MEKILITGSNGLVGNAIKSISKDYPNYDFIFLAKKDCELTNYEETLNIFKKCNPEYIIHLAANVGGLYKNMNQKVEMFEDNLQINYNVVKIAHEIKVKKLIACLSTCIFPDNIKYPINEESLHNGQPHNSNYAYAYAKRMIEIQCRTYKEQYNDNFICIIPTNIYGSFDNFNLTDGHVIPALIHKCYLAKLNNTKFEIAGTGKPLRQFIYSIDLAKIIMNILKDCNLDKIIISVSEKDEISIKEIATIIAKKFNYNDMIYFNSNMSDGQYKKTVDNKKLLSIIGNYQFKNIKEGINETIDWFIENYNNCRK